ITYATGLRKLRNMRVSKLGGVERSGSTEVLKGFRGGRSPYYKNMLEGSKFHTYYNAKRREWLTLQYVQYLPDVNNLKDVRIQINIFKLDGTFIISIDPSDYIPFRMWDAWVESLAPKARGVVTVDEVGFTVCRDGLLIT